MSFVGWLLRHWYGSRMAYCSACGKEAGGMLVGETEVEYAIVCEHCGKRWNIEAGTEDREDPYDSPWDEFDNI